MSMSSSSWCCCSWCRPSSTSVGDVRRSVTGEQPGHRLVDVAAVVADLGRAGAGEQAAIGAGVPLADRLVVRVEEVPVRPGGTARSRRRSGQHEGLEEPGDVRPVPLRRADVGHRLDRLVLGRQGRGQRLGQVPDASVVLDRGRASRRGGAGVHRRHPRPKREATQSSLRQESSQAQMALAGRGKAGGPPGELRIGPRSGSGKGTTPSCNAGPAAIPCLPRGLGVVTTELVDRGSAMSEPPGRLWSCRRAPTSPGGSE